jgi:hypothetical protein
MTPSPATTTIPSGFLLGRALEQLQALVPELLEEWTHLGKSLRPRVVEAFGSLAALGDEAGLLQDTQMLGDCLPRDLEMRGNDPGRELAVQHETEDRPAPRLLDGIDRRR